MHKNKTYDLVELPKGIKALKNKWEFKLNKKYDKKKMRYKIRLVVKGFRKNNGIDFDESFSLVMNICSIRTIIGLAASLD